MSIERFLCYLPERIERGIGLRRSHPFGAPRTPEQVVASLKAGQAATQHYQAHMRLYTDIIQASYLLAVKD